VYSAPSNFAHLRRLLALISGSQLLAESAAARVKDMAPKRDTSDTTAATAPGDDDAAVSDGDTAGDDGGAAPEPEPAPAPRPVSAIAHALAAARAAAGIEPVSAAAAAAAAARTMGGGGPGWGREIARPSPYDVTRAVSRVEDATAALASRWVRSSVVDRAWSEPERGLLTHQRAAAMASLPVPPPRPLAARRGSGDGSGGGKSGATGRGGGASGGNGDGGYDGSVWGLDEMDSYLYDDIIIGLKKGIMNSKESKAVQRAHEALELFGRPRAAALAPAPELMGGAVTEGGVIALEPVDTVAPDATAVAAGAVSGYSAGDTTDDAAAAAYSAAMGDAAGDTAPVPVLREGELILSQALGGLVDLVLRHVLAGWPGAPAIGAHNEWATHAAGVMHTAFSAAVAAEETEAEEGSAASEPAVGLPRLTRWVRAVATALRGAVDAFYAAHPTPPPPPPPPVRDAAALRAEASYIAMHGHPPPPTAPCMQLPPPSRGGDPTLPHAVAARPPPHRLAALLADVLPPPAVEWGFYVGDSDGEVLVKNNYRRSLLHLAIHEQNLLAVLLFVELGCAPDGTGTFIAIVGDVMLGEQIMSCAELAAHLRGVAPGVVATAINTVMVERVAPVDTRRRPRAAATSAAAAVAASSAPLSKRRRA